MSREWTLFIDDAIECCRLILEFTRGLNRESFRSDSRTYHAILRQLEMMGEAVKFIPDAIRLAYPQIAWHSIIATRNILTHVYFSVDDDIIWSVVSEEIAPLMKVLEEIREQLE